MPWGNIVYSPPHSAPSEGGSGWSAPVAQTIGQYPDTENKTIAGFLNDWEDTGSFIRHNLDGSVKLQLNVNNPVGPNDETIIILPEEYWPEAEVDGQLNVSLIGEVTYDDLTDTIDIETSWVAADPAPVDERWVGTITRQKDDGAKVARFDIDVEKVGVADRGAPLFTMPAGYIFDIEASGGYLAFDVNGGIVIYVNVENEFIGPSQEVNISDGTVLQTVLLYPIL